jgi:hypothetical protein
MPKNAPRDGQGLDNLQTILAYLTHKKAKDKG